MKRTDHFTALADLAGAISKWRLAALLGWQDVAQRYRRSSIGGFWLTINMVVMIGAIGLIFGTLFRAPMKDFLPHLAVGIVVWAYISAVIMESSSAFVAAEGMILQVKTPLSMHLLRVLFRNLAIFFHNFLIIPFVILFFGLGLSPIAFEVIPGFIILTLNLMWIGLILGVLCTRYRDLSQVVQNGLQLAFYATPIMWLSTSLPAGTPLTIMEFNPFYHFLELVRAPLLGEQITTTTWLVTAIMLPIGWILAVLIFGRYRRRIPYWL